ncbi:MAG: hypothetical protein DRR16_07380 [Candidatus Parabeggiatoa sp. nov. 3]|jgi:hypothetical protein|nr:MAG: hypothetical protein DRR00_12160 [Gammaproteobacteria bacterium]RKZ62056.1 MAG: hypothetical protein DRQ99_19390 [Gammaproteobacteria bacterium]RKZ87401.1 MAG: hypothetical protein DRR16_07380 [Gammaproteobacteria bacterium]
MSARAEVDLINRNNKSYRFWIYRDGYPDGVVSNLPDDEMEFEDVRRKLYLGDDYDSMPDFYYVISLADRTIEVYDADYSETDWQRGELIFRGTFAEAKQKFLSEDKM